MDYIRQAKNLARFVLVWFALSLGVAMASPLVAPKSMELVCTTGGTMKFGAEAAFQVPSVRKAFDEVGPLIATVRAEGASSPAAARAMEEAERTHSFFTPLTVIELSKCGKEGVKDADTAM
mgnify:CR=1 FL=1